MKLSATGFMHPVTMNTQEPSSNKAVGLKLLAPRIVQPAAMPPVAGVIGGRGGGGVGEIAATPAMEDTKDTIEPSGPELNEPPMVPAYVKP